MTRVKLPDGQIAVFPEGMSHDQIKEVLRKKFPPPEQTQQQNMGRDPFPNMPGWLRSALTSVAQKQSQYPALDQMLQRAGADAEQHITKPIVQSGLPAAAAGLAKGLSAPARFAGGFLPGAAGEQFSAPLPSAPQAPYPQIPGTSIGIDLQRPMGIAGEAAGAITSAGPVYKGAMTAMSALPKIASVPLAAGITGAAEMPESPLVGAALGAASLPVAAVAQYAGKQLFPAAKTLLKKGDPAKGFAQAVEHDKSLRSTYSEIYDAARDEMKRRGGLVNINPAVLDEVQQLPSLGDDFAGILAKARQGDYNAIHETQSELGKRASALYRNKNSGFPEIQEAQKIEALRDRLNQNFESALAQSGHLDIAAMRQQASNLFRQRQSLYANKLLPPQIRKIFDPNIELLPGQTEKDLITPFMQRSNPVQDILDQNPELMREVLLRREKQEALEKLKPVTKVAGTGTALAATSKMMKVLLGLE
jgi:hypothetical protein